MRPDLPFVCLIGNLFSFDHDSGLIHYKPRGAEYFRSDRDFLDWNRDNAGCRAFVAVEPSGYHYEVVNGFVLRAHTAIWASYYGEMPKSRVYHINGLKRDDRISNLTTQKKADRP